MHSVRRGTRSSSSRLSSLPSASFIHSGHFYSAPSSPLLLRGAPDYSADTVSEFHAEAHRQLQVKDLPKVPTWRLERDACLFQVFSNICPSISSFVFLCFFLLSHAHAVLHVLVSFLPTFPYVQTMYVFFFESSLS